MGTLLFAEARRLTWRAVRFCAMAAVVACVFGCIAIAYALFS